MLFHPCSVGRRDPMARWKAWLSPISLVYHGVYVSCIVLVGWILSAGSAPFSRTLVKPPRFTNGSLIGVVNPFHPPACPSQAAYLFFGTSKLYQTADLTPSWSNSRALADTVMAHPAWAAAVMGLLLIWISSPFDALRRVLAAGFWCVWL